MHTTLSSFYSEVARCADTDPSQKIGVDVTSRVLSETAKVLARKTPAEALQIMSRWLGVAQVKCDHDNKDAAGE